jgi:hypothetical protein
LDSIALTSRDPDALTERAPTIKDDIIRDTMNPSDVYSNDSDSDNNFPHRCNPECLHGNYKRRAEFPDDDGLEHPRFKVARSREDVTRLQGKAQEQVMLWDHGFAFQKPPIMGPDFVERAGIVACANKSEAGRAFFLNENYYADVEAGMCVADQNWFTAEVGELLTNVLGRGELIAMVQTSAEELRVQGSLSGKSKHLEFWNQQFDENEARLFHILEYAHTWDKKQFEQAIRDSIDAKEVARWAVVAAGAGDPDQVYSQRDYHLDIGAWEDMPSVVERVAVQCCN